MLRNIVYYSCVLIFLSLIGMRGSLSQPMPKGEAGPNIRLGEIHLLWLGSTLFPLAMLESISKSLIKSADTPNSIELVGSKEEIPKDWN
jgi:hypothetical protein